MLSSIDKMFDFEILSYHVCWSLVDERKRKKIFDYHVTKHTSEKAVILKGKINKVM